MPMHIRKNNKKNLVEQFKYTEPTQCSKNLGMFLNEYTYKFFEPLKSTCISSLKQNSEYNKNIENEEDLCMDNFENNFDFINSCFQIKEGFKNIENKIQGVKMNCGKILCVLLVIFLAYMLLKGNTKNKVGMKQHLQYFFF